MSGAAGSRSIDIERIDAVVFDFDGVLSDNYVYVDQLGVESVRCSRADGLAFDAFRKLGLRVIIVSTEANPVVAARAKKLKVPVIQGALNKADALRGLADDQDVNLSRLVYVGNDLNDYQAMQLCGYSACPADSHDRIKEIATFTLSKRGGEGVARALLEDVLQVDIIQTLYV